MRAITQHRYGGPEQLEFGTTDTPVPGPEEVLVRVRAAGVDRGVWHLMTGTPLLVRLVMGMRGPKNPVPGGDLAGVVEAVGDAVTRWRVGDEVLGFGRGTFAEFAVVPQGRLAAKPASMEWTSAAVIPVSAVTALQALRAAKTSEGSRVLVLGAGGGVGTFVVQLAAHLGAVVTAVTSTSKVELVRSLGASRVIDYSREPLDGEHDIIIDIGGRRPVRVLRKQLAPRGTAIIVGAEGGGALTGGLERNLGAAIVGRFTGQRFVGLFATVNADDLREVVELVEAGAIRAVVAITVPLSEAADALRALEGGPAGKIALAV